jgi:hypothetical protein
LAIFWAYRLELIATIAAVRLLRAGRSARAVRAFPGRT